MTPTPEEVAAMVRALSLGRVSPDHPMDIERAKAVAQVAQVVVDSAKAENDFIKLTGSDGSGFIEKHAALPAGAPGSPRLVKGC